MASRALDLVSEDVGGSESGICKVSRSRSKMGNVKVSFLLTRSGPSGEDTYSMFYFSHDVTLLGIYTNSLAPSQNTTPTGKREPGPFNGGALRFLPPERELLISRSRGILLTGFFNGFEPQNYKHTTCTGKLSVSVMAGVGRGEGVRGDI